MMNKRFTLSDTQNDELGKWVSDFTIGFGRLSAKGSVEDVVSGGRGTLVKVGSLHGILTAAHVVDALPKSGSVAIISHADDPSRFQKQLINMEYIVSSVLRSEEYGKTGPDLAFMRLPPETIGWIAAKHSFFNLSKHRGDVPAKTKPTELYFDMITGNIHELTADVPNDGTVIRRIQFSVIWCGAWLSALRFKEGHELYYFELVHEPGFALPTSFQGTSGGAIWRFYTDRDAASIVERRLFAVPFYESTNLLGKKEITCHGPKDIYGLLVDKVIAQWPEESGQK
jgi:hypothetical protein